MGLLKSLFGTLKCLLCCSPTQQQDSFELYQHQQPQYGHYETTVQLPAWPPPLPSHTQRIHDALPPIPYQQQPPRYETEPHRISVQLRPKLPPRPSHTQRIHDALPPIPYQQQPPRYETELHCISVGSPPKLPPRPSHTQSVHDVLPPIPYQQQQPRYETEPHFVSVQPPPKLRPRPSHTQSVGVYPPAPVQLQQQRPRYESEPLAVAQSPAKLQQGPSRTQWVGRNPVDQENDAHCSLRDRAIEEGDAMAQSFRGSHAAHANGDHPLAKRLSDEGKRHRAEMHRLNKEAGESIFAENNKNRPPGEVDLHGLYVREAIAVTKRVVQEARARGDPQISLIVGALSVVPPSFLSRSAASPGKGLHSRAGAKIKPAIEGLMKKSKLVTSVDPSNAGVLIVRLEA